MVSIDFSTLVATARELASASSKLLVVVAAPASGKTRLLQQISFGLGWPILNVGKEVSQRLLNLTKRQMRIKGAEVLSDALDATDEPALCLDNTEVLFDPVLALNPVNLLLNVSRNRVLVVAWNGQLENGSLVYAYPGHPEHFRVPANGFPVVTLTEGSLHLFLQP